MNKLSIRPIEWRVFAGKDFVPQAVLARPPSYFERRCGLTFTEDLDDLNYSNGAAFEFGEDVFALIQYRGTPVGETTLYILCDPRDVPVVRATLKEIVHQLGLDEEQILSIRDTK